MKKVYIMIGCPGSGKSTWVKEHELPFVSRDEVRIKLGFCKEGEKYLGSIEEEGLVTGECEKQRQDLINDELDFAIDDTNIRKFRRSLLIEELRRNGYHVVGIKMKTPLSVCIERRKDQIPAGAVKSMWELSQDVDPHEFDEFMEV